MIVRYGPEIPAECNNATEITLVLRKSRVYRHKVRISIVASSSMT